MQASDIAQKKSQAVLLPLVDQLFKRAVYILKRLVDIVDKMMENKRKANIRRTGINSAAASPLALGTIILVIVLFIVS